MTYVILTIPAAFLAASVAFAIKAVCRGTKAQKALAMQLFSFIIVGVACLASSLVVNAAEVTTEVASTAAAGSSNGFAFIAAALVTGLSGIGGGVAVAAAAPAAIGATSEDPKVFGKALIFVALGEGIALYGLLVSILILNKV